MPGAMQIAFRREPSYFQAGEVEGSFRQTVVCRHGEQIVGCGGRSIAARWVNGAPQPIGYLGRLRLLPQHRRQGLVPRGYAFFRKLHADGRTPLYLTTIAADNRIALDQLTSGRAGLPQYHDAGRYHTLVMTRRRLPPAVAVTGLTLRRAALDDRPAILEFLAAVGPRRQFFPHLAADDLFADRGLYRGLAPSDVWLAWRDGRLCGTLGVWDQRTFRQSQIVGYSGGLRLARPAYNLVAPLVARPQLPRPGAMLACRFAAFPLTCDDEPAVLAALLHVALRESLAPGESLLCGMHETDPLRAVLDRFAALRYVTRLFHVCFADGESHRDRLDGRPAYLELGSL